jgi:DNA-directed RNA polymerase subunit RPC12/RpoP
MFNNSYQCCDSCAEKLEYEELEKGDGLHCELCGVKVEYLDDLNEYDDMFNNSYQCCDSCAEKLEQGIRNIAFAIRDKAFRNKNRQHK